MDFSFNEVLEDLGAFRVFQLANQARPASRYLFNSLLPETNLPDYSVESGSMTITPTMAGLTGESSAYAKVGHIQISKFLEKTGKLSAEVPLSEGALRKLQQFVREAQIAGNSTNEFLAREVLNFLNKVIIQSHIDAMEWLRSQALTKGAIDWTYGQNRLKVDYGIPAGNFIAKATGTEAYDQASSTFWKDVRDARAKLNYNIRAFIAHPTTILAIMANEANSIEVLNDDGGVFRFRRLIGNNERPSQDARDTVEVIAYGEQGNILDPNNPEQTVKVDFMPTGKILAVANNSRNDYRVGEGATDDPARDRALGYTHIGPTVEGGGQAGRWARLWTPDSRPWQLVGQGVTNGLPVIEAEDKLCVLETELS